MAGENIDFKVRVLGVKQLVDLNNPIQATSKELSEKKKALKTDEKGQQENMKSVLQLTDTLKKQRQEFREGTKQQQKVQTETKKTTSFTMKMATAFGVAQLAVGGFQKVVGFLSSQMKDSINVFKEFDFQMQKVRAISGATDLEFKRLKESAEALGRTTFFTATQVAELQTNLSKLGFSATEILQAQNATLATATASGENLARTATVMGSAIRGFGLDASEATRVADVMATAFTSSALDIEKFQTSMTKVAPIAKMAGFEIEGTTAILASLTDAGIEASIAGTSLRNILLRLADPTSDLSKRLGGSVSSVDELIPRLKEMKDSGIALSDVLGITDRRTAAAFGRMLDSSENVEILTNALRNSEGAAAAMAAIVGDSLQGAMLRFKSATDGLKIALVDLFGDKLQKGFDSAAKFFNNLASKESVKRISNVVKTLALLVKTFAIYTIGVKASSLATLAYSKILRFIFIPAAAGGSKAVALMSVSLKAFRSALISTGIGAFLVGLAAAVAHLAMFDDSIKEAKDTLGDFDDLLDKNNTSYEAQSKNSERLIQIKKELNKITDKEGKLIEGSLFNQGKYTKLKREESVLIVKLNKDMKKYTNHLISEKSSITDINTATKELIETMKQRQAVQIFQDMSKGILKSSLAVEKLKKDFIDLEIDGVGFGGNEEGALKNLELILNRLQSGTSTLMDSTRGWFASIVGIDEEEQRQAMIDFVKQFLSDNDMTVGSVKKYFDDTKGVYDSEMKDLRKHIEDEVGIDPATVLLGGGDDDGDGDEAFVTASERIQKEMKQRKAKILSDETLLESERTEKLLLLEQEYLGKLRGLQVKHKKDIEDTDIKIANNRAKIRNFDFQQEIKDLEEHHNLKKEKTAALEDEGVDGNIVKSLQLNQELEFLTAKLGLHEQYSQDYEDIYGKIIQTDRELSDVQRSRFNQTITEVSELGGQMQSLGNVMGENHQLTKVGIKLTQAAALASSIMAARTEFEALAKAKLAMTEAGLGVAAQAKQLFPMNIAAIAATIAAITSAMSLFGMSGGGGSRSIKGEAVNVQGGDSYKFANGGLTNGGMFRGKSHANGGIKFASGGRIHEAEGGEAIINKRSTSMFKPVLSAINSYNGNGVKFADGGLLNSGERFAQGGQLADIQGMISQQQVTQQVIMVESDVTRSQGKVSAIESQATF
jgi:TP901 family phage tail tape measure protein